MSFSSMLPRGNTDFLLSRNSDANAGCNQKIIYNYQYRPKIGVRTGKIADSSLAFCTFCFLVPIYRGAFLWLLSPLLCFLRYLLFNVFLSLFLLLCISHHSPPNASGNKQGTFFACDWLMNTLVC